MSENKENTKSPAVQIPEWMRSGPVVVLSDHEKINPLFWQTGQCGNSNIVTFDGEDVRGVAYVENAQQRCKLIVAHNNAVRRLLTRLAVV